MLLAGAVTITTFLFGNLVLQHKKISTVVSADEAVNDQTRSEGKCMGKECVPLLWFGLPPAKCHHVEYY